MSRQRKPKTPSPGSFLAYQDKIPKSQPEGAVDYRPIAKRIFKGGDVYGYGQFLTIKTSSDDNSQHVSLCLWPTLQAAIAVARPGGDRVTILDLNDQFMIERILYLRKNRSVRQMLAALGEDTHHTFCTWGSR